MPKLPTDRKYTGRFESEGVPEGTTVADLWKKIRSGEELSPVEKALVEEQREAQEAWWEVDFIVAPERP